MDGKRFVTNGRAVFMLETVLDDVELQVAHGANNPPAIQLADKKLGDAFVHQLFQPFGQLFGFQGIGIVYEAEKFGRKAGNPLEVQRFALGKGISDLKIAGIVQADDIPRIGFIDHGFFCRHEGGGVGKLHFPALADVQVVGVALEFPGADSEERDPVAVVGVHIRMDLEHKPGELVFFGVDDAFFGGSGQRLGRDFHEAVQQFPDAEVIHGASEEYRGNFSRQILVSVEFRINGLDDLEFFPQGIGIWFPYVFVERISGKVGDFDFIFFFLFAVRPEEDQFFFVQAVDAFKPLPHANRPAQGSYANIELFLDFVQQIKSVFALPVEFVDEHDDGGIAHAAHVDQFFGLGFHPFSYIDHDDGAIYSGEGTVGVFGKIFVAGGVQDIDFQVAVVECHDRGGDRNTPLALDLHEVGGSAFFNLVGFNGACNLNGASKKQEFFGKGSFPGIRVADDSERPPFLKLS